jgi:AcrR family transcriptional regulator
VAKPLISVEAIYDGALRVLDAEGADGLKARNLAARLHCSTRTLYEQVGNREALIRGLVAHAFAKIEPDFREGETWQESTTSWCLALRNTLLSRPELARLMTREDRNVVVGYINRLLKVLFAHGFEHELAVRSCRVLAHATLSLTAADLQSPAGHGDLEVFDTTVAWLIRGMESTSAGR